MAYVITAANVKPSDNSTCEVGKGGEGIAVGDAVYFDTTLQKWFKADANDATVAAVGGAVARNAGIGGIAVSACAGDGCRFVVCTSDTELAIGATTTDVMGAGEVGVLGTTAGAVQPAPAASGAKTTIVWISNSATQVKLVKSTGGSVA
jgi:hypothetical protein